MTRQLLKYLIVTPLFMVGCTSNSEQITFRNDQQTQIVYAHGGQTGRFTLFVSEELADGLESGDVTLPEGVTLTRALYEDPEFESRHRAAGLHRWYYAEVDESVPLTKAGETLSGLDGLYMSIWMALPFAEWLYRKSYRMKYGVDPEPPVIKNLEEGKEGEAK